MSYMVSWNLDSFSIKILNIKKKINMNCMAHVARGSVSTVFSWQLCAAGAASLDSRQCDGVDLWL